MGRAPLKPPVYTKLRHHLVGRGQMYKIAAAAGINPSLLSQYSLGTKTPIQPGHLEALSRILGVPADDLVGVMDSGQLEELARP